MTVYAHLPSSAPYVQTGYIDGEKTGHISGKEDLQRTWRVTGEVGDGCQVSLVGSSHGHDEGFVSLEQVDLELHPPPPFGAPERHFSFE